MDTWGQHLGSSPFLDCWADVLVGALLYSTWVEARVEFGTVLRSRPGPTFDCQTSSTDSRSIRAYPRGCARKPLACGMCRSDEPFEEPFRSNQFHRSCGDKGEPKQHNCSAGKHATVFGDGNRYFEHGGYLEGYRRHGLQRRSVWYHLGRRTLHPTGECTFPRNTQCHSDQRGGSHQISFGERYPCRGGCGFAEYHSGRRGCSYSQHGLFHSQRDRYCQSGRSVELEWGGLQRRLLRVPCNDFVDGCLYGAWRTALAAERNCSCDQRRGTEQDGGGNGNHRSRCRCHRESG
jgi:hypothetical protein